MARWRRDTPLDRKVDPASRRDVSANAADSSRAAAATWIASIDDAQTRRPKPALKRSEANMTNYINSAIAAILQQVARSMRYPSARAALLLVMAVASAGRASAAAN